MVNQRRRRKRKKRNNSNLRRKRRKKKKSQKKKWMQQMHFLQKSPKARIRLMPCPKEHSTWMTTSVSIPMKMRRNPFLISGKSLILNITLFGIVNINTLKNLLR
ncbi:unnamed protein product [Acanthoscelides obtectus]|uniref:Uncharacterized protein n=1 Tax=Acanthoscelides obtectus TaxID=200917 RepID=A0A9P0KZV9_ACAOB|nr:unnamed protein product [Acanthoscelides obtectus]CAK1681892.1 hypothetical protein AOBTE_LOCUS33322 [Acanthoscelides obtectus]